eukprot:jgi/Ulvmu1/2692/UM014_0148.1
MFRRALSAAYAAGHGVRNAVAKQGYCNASGIKQGQKYVPDGKKGLKWVDDRLQSRITFGNYLAGGLAVVGGYVVYSAFRDPDTGNFQKDVHFSNWSATHAVQCDRVFEPETEEEVVGLIRRAIAEGWTLRVLGSGISPNALAFSDKCMISMAQMDQVLHVDTDTKQVRVQAGAKVQDVVEALREHGLTLQNYASVRDQQIGGFTQVSAHGTGAELPPVDMQVVSMRVVSPGLGQAVELQRDTDAAFEWAKVGLGSMGVVTEVTLQCVQAHRLLEETTIATRSQVERNHAKWLKQNKHLRYMWIPYTDSVIVVKCNPTKQSAPPGPGWFGKTFTDDEKLKPLRELLQSATGAAPAAELSATQLRDELIKENPLDQEWIKQVNRAEAEFWKRNSGYRVGWSDEILGFDCGGQQWVLEVAFPTDTNTKCTHDLRYMADVLELIEREQIAAPAPIEQRWSASSSAPMSPAHSEKLTDVHSWVGIIMYLPTEDPKTRREITEAFEHYAHLCEKEIMPKYGAKWHWAKLEPGEDQERLERVQQYLRQQYDIRRFNHVRHTLDPQNNLGNKWLNAVIPLTREA